MNPIFISPTNNTFTFLMLHKSEHDLQLTSLTERRPACSSASASLGCMSFRAQKQRKGQSHICTTCFWLDCWKLSWNTAAIVRIRNTPIKDVWQVKLQQTFSQGHKRQQAGVEEEQKQQTSAHGEAVRHRTVLEAHTGHKIELCAQKLKSTGYQ